MFVSGRGIVRGNGWWVSLMAILVWVPTVSGAALAEGVGGTAEVALDLRADVPFEGAELVVRRNAGDEGEAVAALPLEKVMAVPVAGKGLAVTCRGVDVWCPEIVLRDGAVALPVFPAMTVSARLAGKALAELPTGGLVQGIVVEEGVLGRAAVELHATVAVQEGRIVFTAPRAQLDLRFAFLGAAPVYQWDVKPPAGEAVEEAEKQTPALDLGTLVLQPGGSLSGWVKRQDDELPVEGATVAVFPASSASGDVPEDAGRSLHRWTTTTESNGFFQVSGLPPGTFRLQAAAPGLVEQILEGVETEAGSETLVGTVFLSAPVRLSLQVHPAVDPRGGRWKVRFDALRRLPGEKPVEVTVGEDGTAEVFPLRKTEYFVQVGEPPADALLAQAHTVTGDGWLRLDVPVVEVEGTVRLGGEPVQATVRLEVGAGDRVEIETDEDGRLAGWMRAPERRWLMATVRWKEGEEERERLLEVVPSVEDERVVLELDLPAGSILGEVVDGEGRPQRGVRVRATLEEEAGPFQEIGGRTDRNGRFRLTGLESRPYLVRAGGNGGPASEVARVDLSGILPVGEARLVLRPVRRLEGQVTAGGRAVPGARVSVVGVGPVPEMVFSDADAGGRFAFDLPEAMDRAVFTVMAPSQVLWSGCLPLPPPDQPLVLSLPTLPAGTLSIASQGSSELPPLLGGRKIILTGDGGFLTWQELVAWTRLRGGQMHLDAEAGTEVLELPGLPPSTYALTWTGAPPWEIAARTCNGTFPDADWSTLPPGGEALLELDLTEDQERRLEQLEER